MMSFLKFINELRVDRDSALAEGKKFKVNSDLFKFPTTVNDYAKEVFDIALSAFTEDELVDCVIVYTAPRKWFVTNTTYWEVSQFLSLEGERYWGIKKTNNFRDIHLNLKIAKKPNLDDKIGYNHEMYGILD
jgi:hypothetical protein